MNSFSKEQRLNMDVLAADTKEFAQHIHGMKVTETNHFVAVNTRLSSYNFNIMTLCEPFQQEMAPIVLQKIKAMNEQKLPFNLWCYAVDLAAVQFLQANQLQLYPETYVAMNAPIASLELRSADQLSDELIIQQVKTLEHIDHFVEVLQTVYPEPMERQAIKSYYELVGETIDFNKVKTTLFVGYYKNLPVVTGAFTIKEKAAGIFHIATKEQFRGKGLATTMMDFLLKRLKNKSVTELTLQSSAAGKGIYESFGFQIVGELKAFENKHLIT